MTLPIRDFVEQENKRTNAWEREQGKRNYVALVISTLHELVDGAVSRNV